MKKRGILLVLILVAMLIVLSACSSGGNDVSKTYDQAMNSLKKGEFAKAADDLSGISFYEDSVQLGQYCRAHAYASEGKYDDALSLLNALGGYRDSDQWYAYYFAKGIEESASTPGSRAYAASLYSKEILREFKDAYARAESIRSALYSEGTASEENEEWSKASEIYDALDGYLDSTTRYYYVVGRNCELQGESSPMSYITAIMKYELAGSYSDSKTRAKNCLDAVYKKASKLIGDGDFDNAEALYIALGDHCDESKKAELQKAREDAEEAARQTKIAEAEALAKENKFDEARELYLEIGETKHAMDALFQKAEYLAREGKTKEAATLYLSIGDHLSREKHFNLGVSLIESDPVTASGILIEDVEYEGAKEKLYEIAVKASSDKQYPLSVAVYRELGSIKDCQLRMRNDLYLYGRQLMEGKENDEAAAIFDSISGVGSADLYANMARYAAAEKLEEDGLYDKAAEAFEQISDYVDAAERSMKCRYAFGTEEKKAGSYENAIAIFNSLGEYEDSTEQGKESKFLLAKQYEESGNWTEAISLYEALGTYNGSETRCKACYNNKAEVLLSGGDTLGAYQLFVKGDNSDGQARAALAVAEGEIAEYKLEDALTWYQKAADLPETEVQTAMIAENLLNMEEDALSEGYASVVSGSEKSREILYALAIRSLERQDEDAAMRQMQKAGDNADASERFKEMLNARVEKLVADGKYGEAADLCSSYGDQEQAEALLKQKAEKEEEEKQRIAKANREKHQARIDEANVLLEKEEYEAAAVIFKEIGEEKLAEDAVAKQTAAEEAKRAAEEEEKRQKYQAREEEGNRLLTAGDYDGALAIYRELENEDLINETIYQKAEALNQPNLYLEIIEYKDSREKHYLAGKALLDSDPENAYRILADDIGYQDTEAVLYELASRESAAKNYPLSFTIFSLLGQQPMDPSDPRPDCQMRAIQDMYQYGLDLQAQGEWQLAADIFDKLKGLSQATLHSNEAYYSIAVDLEKNEKYSQAALSFESLGDYSDAAERAKQNRYQAAKKQMEALNYEAAEKAFIILGSYSDSSDMAKECRYQQALGLLKNGDYATAMDLFKALDQYSDSVEQMNECIYLIASGLQEQGEYEQAIGQYEAIKEYKDVAERTKNCYEALGDQEVAKAEEMLKQDARTTAAENYETAYDYYSNAGKTDKMLATALMIGSCYQSMNDLSSAIDWYKKAGDKGKEYLLGIAQYALTTEQNDVANNLLAEIALDEERFEDAVLYYQKITDTSFVKEREKEAYYKYGTELLGQKEYEMAVNAFSKCNGYSDAEMKTLETYYLYGIDLLEAKEYEGAVAEFKNAGEYEDAATKVFEAYYQFGEASLSNSDFDKAIEMFSLAGDYSDAKDQIYEAWTLYGENELAMDHFDKAKEYFLNAGNQERHDAAMLAEANNCIKNGEYKKAYDNLISIIDYPGVRELIHNNEVFTPFIMAPGEIVRFGHYDQDNNLDNGKEEIEWIILDVQEDKLLLLSKYGLDAMPYNTSNKITWEKSSLRKWLNEGFINAAFSEEEKAVILLTAIDNTTAQCVEKWGTNGGNNTKDKVFLLSYAEVNKYLNANTSSRSVDAIVIPTQYAIARGAVNRNSIIHSREEKISSWWLRSPGSKQNYACYITSMGTVGSTNVSNRSTCIRPAIWVNLGSSLIATRDDYEKDD